MFMLPLNIVDDIVPVLGLYVILPSISKPTLPVLDVAPSTKVIKFSSFVLSLSVTKT